MNKAALVEDLIVCVLHEPTLVATIVGFTKYFPFEMVKWTMFVSSIESMRDTTNTPD